ncbi:fluoride efflux transporter FluC [Kandleria vitulina]|uniref:fluoride efflux transporter FluC n=1 Tax=Kandleria vitulina TaxID=1630 RepID=UPI0033215025
MKKIEIIATGGTIAGSGHMGKTTNYRILYFQIKTFLINVVGCLFIGLITVAAGRNTAIDEKWILFLKVGFCGGFTTFSTFALETTEPMKNGHLGIAFLYVLSSILVGCLVIIGVEYLLMK